MDMRSLSLYLSLGVSLRTVLHQRGCLSGDAEGSNAMSPSQGGISGSSSISTSGFRGVGMKPNLSSRNGDSAHGTELMLPSSAIPTPSGEVGCSIVGRLQLTKKLRPRMLDAKLSANAGLYTP